MKKRIALALILGATMAFGAVACDSSSSTSTTSGGTGGTDSGPCSLATDTDTGTITFDVTTLQIPKTASGDGFDLDGVKSDGTTTPVASDSAGCYWKDIAPAGGVKNVDNQLAAVNAAASVLGIDISKALQDAVSTGGVKLRAVIGHWNNQLTDSCLSVEVQADTGTGYTTVGMTSTSITNGLTPVFALGAPVNLTVAVTLPTGTGTGQCNPSGSYAAGTTPCTSSTYSCTAHIPLTIEGVKLRAHVVANAGSPGGYKLVTNTPNTGGATVANPSMLGGYLVYWDTTSGRPACDNSHVSGNTFEAAMQQAVCDLGQGTLWGQACPIIAQNLDLHDMSGTLNACAAGGTTTTSNANSLSLGAYVGSM